MDAFATEQLAPSLDATSTDSKGGQANGSADAGHGATVKESEHNFQKAISAWKGIDLGSLVPQLDKTAAEIVENQKEAVVQRKDLAQKTKDFRKLDDAAKLTEVKVLLKAYQNFIDLLTNHHKTSSSGFLQIYSPVSEAPDPYPLLEASVESLVAFEDVPKLSAENERLQRSVREKTKRVDDLEGQLQRERALRKELEDSREEKAKQIEASWQGVLNESKENWEAKERALEEKVENQERLFSEIKASYEVNQRLGQGNTNDNAQASASAAELELLNSDLERTSARLAEMESRNEQLRVELAQASSSGASQSNIEDDPAFIRLQSENSQLLGQLDAAKTQKGSELRQLETRVKTLERETRSAKQDSEDLRQKLSKWKDYPELKRELDVFKALEFSTGDDDEEAGADDVSALDANGSAKKDSLEQLLLARNKKQSDELAVMRVSVQTLRRELEQSSENASVAHAELERIQHLNTRLETDLLNLQSESANQFSSGRSVVGGASRHPGSTWGRTRRSSPTSSIISGFDSQRASSSESGEPMGGGSGMLPLVQAQRDRFKQKITQLEAELSKQYASVSSLRQEVQGLQKDNLSLYEKTRYVSTYQRQPAGATSSASAYNAAPSSSTMRVGEGDASSSGVAMDRYRSAYEASLSPFAAFRGREATRAYRRMSLPERAVYGVLRVVLATRTSRNLFAAYCLALHLLVFMMLYWMGSVDVQRHASNLGDSATAAAAGAAGLAGAAGGLAPGAVGDAHHGDWQQEAIEGVTNP